MLWAAVLVSSSCFAFIPTADLQYRTAAQYTSLNLAADDKNPKTIDPLSKTSWYVVEAFGNVFGKKKSKSEEKEMDYSTDAPPQSIEETLQRIQDDFKRSYFLSGEVDALIYDEKCVFSDPFVSFEGRDRFITNLANLGSFVTKFSVRPLEFKADDPLNVKTKVVDWQSC